MPSGTDISMALINKLEETGAEEKMPLESMFQKMDHTQYVCSLDLTHDHGATVCRHVGRAGTVRPGHAGQDGSGREGERRSLQGEALILHLFSLWQHEAHFTVNSLKRDKDGERMGEQKLYKW